MFKVGTECTLCCTLRLAVMLRFDLSEEDISEPVVGLLMLCANTIVPGTTLAVGVLTQGLEFPEAIGEIRAAGHVERMEKLKDIAHKEKMEEEDNPVFEQEQKTKK